MRCRTASTLPGLAPREGVRSCMSGFQVQGTASSPLSTAKMYFRHRGGRIWLSRQSRRGGAAAATVVAERGGFEPPVQFPAHTLSKRAP